MTTPHLIMWGVVLAVGLLASTRNPTALALAFAWLAGEAVYLMTGNNLPVEFYLFPDIFVIAVIMAKAEACNLRPYRNTWHQLKCILLERSVADRAILLIFPVMWALYVAPFHPFYVWWCLYLLCVAQFLAAGWEAFSLYRRELSAASNTPDFPGELLVAYGGRGYG